MVVYKLCLLQTDYLSNFSISKVLELKDAEKRGGERERKARSRAAFQSSFPRDRFHLRNRLPFMAPD